VVAEARADQSVATRYGYSPYGETVRSGEESGNSTRYTGRENDGTGMYYYRARYYEPLTNRFSSEDPFKTTGNSQYAYSLSSPISLNDPLGAFPPLPPPTGIRNPGLPSHVGILPGRRDSPGNISRGLYWSKKAASSLVESTMPVSSSSCGAKKGPIWPNRYGPSTYSLEPACRRHDRCYETCGVSKATCDAEFFMDILVECATDPRNIGRIPECHFVATGYYTAVLAGGFGAFRDARAHCKNNCGP
jgi:RHS repeat-associated protein